MLATFNERALHPAPSKQHRDATFDAGAESLPALERRALFERFPFGAALPSRLRDAGERDTGRLACLNVVFVEEAAIGAIRVGCGIKDRLVAVERRLDMDLVGGVSAEHTILRDQPVPALGQEHLVTELHRFEHLPALDQIRVGFENGVELFLGGYLLAMKDPPACLTDDTDTELAVARDVTPKGVDRALREKVETPNAHGSLDDGPRLSDHLLGDPDERAIRAHLLTVSLPCRHALNLLHPAPSAARAVRERPDARREQDVQLANEPRQDAHRIPQQRVIGGMMNIGLDDRSIDPQLGAIFEAETDRRVDDRLIDRLQRVGGQPVEGPVERVVLGDPLAVEVGEVPQRVPISNAFAQFTIIPILDAHQNHLAEHLWGRQADPSRRGPLQAAREIPLHALDDGPVVVEALRDRFQGGLKLDALYHELQID